MERASVHHDFRWKLGAPDRRRGCGRGTDHSDDKGMQRLLSSNFQIGGDASAAAGPVGRHAEAGTDWKMDTEILTYSRAKGAFAGLTLEGASLRQDNDSRHAIYGSNVTTRALLLGKVPAPSAAKPFLAEIRGAKAEARADKR